jgi:hypothetical protein
LAEYSSSAARTLTLTNNGVNYALSGSGGTITAQSGVGQIGRGSNTSGFTGYINEIIIYNRVLTTLEKDQIHTYLAVKYGLAASASNHLYYNESGFNNDIFGIGKDFASQGLNVTTSNSVSADDIMEVRTPSSLDDGDYLVFGNNNGANTFAPHAGSNCLYSSKLSRTWKCNRVNDPGTVSLRFDMTGITGFSSDKLALVIDTDGDGIDDETAITGLYSEPYFEVSNLSIADGAQIHLVQQDVTWYAIASGNSSGAIWSTSLAGPPQAITTFCPNSQIVIRPGISVTNDWANLECKNLTIDATGIWNAGSGTTTITENMTVNGTLNAQTSTFVFAGAQAQTLNGTNLVNFNNATLQNALGLTISSSLNGVHLRGYLNIISGQLSTNNKLILISDISGTGMIGPLSGGSILGDVTVQRYHAASNTGWINLCSPVQSKTLQDWNDDLTTTGFNGADIPPPYSFNNVQRYNEAAPGGINSGYVGATDITNPIIANAGYFLYQPAGAMTIDVTGTIYSGDQTIPVTFTNTGNASADGWNMVANPYPCTIDWNDADWVKTNMNNAVYIFNAATGLYASYVNGVSSNGGSRYIASSQSFFVVANAASPVLTAREGVKANVNGTFRSVESAGSNLSLQLSGGGIVDEVVLHYTDAATARFEGTFDAFKLRSPMETAPYFAAISDDGYDLSVYSTARPTAELLIPLRIEVGSSGTYTFTPIGLDAFAGGACIVLEDLLNGNQYPLREGSPIELNLSAGTEQLRFQLRIGGASIATVSGSGCPGQNEGKVEFNAGKTKGLMIDWMASDATVVAQSKQIETSESIEGLAAGQYTALIHQNGVCGTTKAVFEIQQNEDLQALADVKPATCANSKDGHIEVEILGGTGVYELTWSDGHKSARHSGIGQGVYTLFVRDQNGCDKTFEFAVPVLSELAADFEMISNEFELINGAVEVGFYNTSFGAANYQWNFGDATILTAEENATHLFNQKGIFDVTLTAKNTDCQAQITKQVRIVSAKNQGNNLAAEVIGRLTEDGVELRFFFSGPHKLRISAYNVLGQQIIEPIVSVYQGETIHFSDRRYAANAIVEVLDLESGERAIIRMGN